MKILIVEDNERLGHLVGGGLEKHGVHYDLAPSLAYASRALQSSEYDAIILDLILPDGRGLDWLAGVRLAKTIPPVVVLTAQDGLGDCVAGLDAGADDYLVKPVAMDELAARLRALIRRPSSRTLPVMRVGTLAFDSASRTVQDESGMIELTRRETDLLELLMRRAGAVVRRPTIEAALYNLDHDITPNAVEAVVSRLRQKLNGDNGYRIVTIRGEGYMLRDDTS